jgi:hypothetical protein
LCLTLSHQYIEQLSPPVRQAVFGNVGTLIAFRIGYADAEVMEKEFGKTFTASALADLEQYETAVKLLEDGTNQEPFRAKMLPPLENRTGRKEKLVALSRERFATPRAVIEDKLKRWMDGPQLQGGASDVCESRGSHRAIAGGLGKGLAGKSARKCSAKIVIGGF